MGRPREHDREALGLVLCERVSCGELVKDVCQDLGIAPSTPWRWAQEDTAFGNAYARARELQAHAHAEDGLRIADGRDVETIAALEAIDAEAVALLSMGADPDAVKRRLKVLERNVIARDRLRVDQRKWLAARLAPRSYGDRLDVTSGGERVQSGVILMPAESWGEAPAATSSGEGG